MNASIKMRLQLMVAVCGACFVAAPVWADTPATAATQQPPKAKSKWVKTAQKHNGSGIQMSYTVPGTLSAGQPATVRLRLSGVTQDDASVKITGPAGVTLASTSSAALGAGFALPRDRTTELVVQVTPSADGLDYLNVFTTQGGRTTAQSVPLQVGSAKPTLKTMGKAETTPSGEKVISLPSQ